MPKVIAVCNLKGGCGKSTIAVNLACELALRSGVVLIDADEQGTATTWASGGSLPAEVKTMPLGDGNPSVWMQRVLDVAGEAVMIDCPPHVGTATQAAVAIADLVLIPVTASGADIMATASAIELVEQAKVTRKGEGPECLMVPSRIDRRTAVGREIEKALKRFGEPIGPAVSQRTAFVDSFSAGQWIGDYAKGSPAHKDIEALARAVRKGAKL